MPCSSTDDGAWGGSLANHPFVAGSEASNGASSSSRLRSQQGQDWGRCLVSPAPGSSFPSNTSAPTVPTQGGSRTISHHEVAEALRSAHTVATAPTAGSSSLAALPPVPPFRPMQLKAAAAAAAAAAHAAAHYKNKGEQMTSDGDNSDMDFFTPLSSPLRDIPVPALPLTDAAAVDAPSAKKQQQQDLPTLPPPDTTGGSLSGASLRTTSNSDSLNSRSTSNLLATKQCGLVLGRFPLRRRYMSADCGDPRPQGQQQLQQQRNAEAAAAAVAELHMLARTAAAADTAKERMTLRRGIAKGHVPARRFMHGALLLLRQQQQQQHQQHWLHRQQQLRLQQQQRQRLQREASDEDIRMPLVPPPASLSPLLSGARVAPPTLQSLPFATADAPDVADFARAPPGEDPAQRTERAATAPEGERERLQQGNPATLLSQMQQQHQQLHQQLHQQQQEYHQKQQEHQEEQQQEQEEEQQHDYMDEWQQGSKRRRFSMEQSDALHPALTVHQPTAPLTSTLPRFERSDSGSSLKLQHQQQQQQEQQNTAAASEVLDFSTHRKRKRGGDCSTRLLLTLQPNAAAAADAALLDVLGTALTAEETRELRVQQQKEAERAAAAEAEAAQARAAAAAAAEAAAAQAKAAAEAAAAAACAKAQAEAEKAAAAAASRKIPNAPASGLVQPTAGTTTGTPPATPAPPAAAPSLFGRPALPQVQQQAQQQQQQPQQLHPQQQPQQQLQQPQQLLQQPQQMQQGIVPNGAAAAGDFAGMQGRPKLRIRRANAATPGAGAAPGEALTPHPPPNVQQQQQQQQQVGTTVPAFGQQQQPQQQQMDVQGSLFRLHQAPQQPLQQQIQIPQQIQMPQQLQMQQQAPNGLGLGLAQFGPSKVTEAADAGNNPFAFVAGRGRGRGGRRGGMRRR